MKALLGECQSGIYIGSMHKARIKQDRIAVIGYGSQGRAMGLNLKDSGYVVAIALPPKSKSRRLAKKDGFKSVGTISQIVKEADIICFAFPDYLHGRVYDRDIRNNLKKNATLLFLHGFSVHFGFVKLPKSSDVILMAPHAPGLMVREKFLGDRSLSAFYAIAQNRSGNAANKALHLAAAIGFKKRNLVKTTFELETIGDLFGEQAVLCGGLASLIKNGFEVLIENGVPAVNAYLEVAYQLDQIIALIKKFGINGMFDRISVAAQLGSIGTGPYVVDRSVKKRMQQKLKEIVSGNFARELNSLSKSHVKSLKHKTRLLSNRQFEQAVRKFNITISKG